MCRAEFYAIFCGAAINYLSKLRAKQRLPRLKEGEYQYSYHNQYCSTVVQRRHEAPCYIKEAVWGTMNIVQYGDLGRQPRQRLHTYTVVSFFKNVQQRSMGGQPAWRAISWRKLLSCVLPIVIDPYQGSMFKHLLIPAQACAFQLLQMKSLIQVEKCLIRSQISLCSSLIAR